MSVPALKGSERIARALQGELKASPGVLVAKASPVTGTVLLLYSRSTSSTMMMARLVDGLGASVAPGEPAARWHEVETQAVAGALATSQAFGLSNTEAKKRLTQFGPNQLPRPTPRSALAILKDQFTNLPIGLLGVAGLVSLATGAALEAVAILAAIGLNAAIGYTTESRAEKIIKGIGEFAARSPKAIRDGDIVSVPAPELVPGDVLLLTRGMVIAADARIVEASQLRISEAALTGESAPASKQADILFHGDVPLADRKNMAYRGTFVTSGSGRAIVVATGARTEVGRVQALVSDSPPP